MFKPTHRHYKGDLYQVLAAGTDATNERQGTGMSTEVIVYRDQANRVWVRDRREFEGRVNFEGKWRPRFQKLPAGGPDG